MSERSKLISKLLTDRKARFAYIKAKLGVLVPSQIRALRLRSGMLRQADLAKSASMQQSRISTLETPGANVTIETLATLAAVFKVGLVVKFVPFSEMLQWENSFSQDLFNVLPLNEDRSFLSPPIQPGACANTAPLYDVIAPTSYGAGFLGIPEQYKGSIALRYATATGQRDLHNSLPN
jgi:transcriptional regulator with XRE-family HTH domain